MRMTIENTTVATISESQIVFLLREFSAQKPNFSLCNYSTMADYKRDYKRMSDDRKAVKKFASYVSYTIDADMKEALLSALSSWSRLTIKDSSNGVYLEYCKGQYFPTEYQYATARVLASAIWDYWRDVEKIGKPFF